MKTFLTTIITILAFTITCSAQWTTSGTNIYNSNTGNVGIGSTTPTLGKLQINGAADVLTLIADGGPLQFNGWTNSDFRIIERANAPMTFWTNTIERMRIDQSGNVGIGTTAPGVKLDVNGAERLGGNLTFLTDQTAYFITGPANGGAIRIRSNANTNTDRNVQLGVIDNLGNFGCVLIAASNGYVGIGTTSPDQMLTVNGTAHARTVIVDNSIFPDYVFARDYNLPALSAVKTYIDQNHHLPEVPSAAEVEKNGQNLGEMNTLLLKKVEELTLYMIDLNKTVKAQQKEIDRLKVKKSNK